ncbi:MAG TPA: MerR family transcriptional regulator [Candidatus Sulfomarinibacteraceae bacterium]|nr:MerR family transcriptional regulator [Candidatus Sulfomarinibacteraceae bacterium]
MAEKLELPEDQDFFKLNEVCKLANVQPYMLRFWGTEFEQLETTTTDTGQRLYSRPQMNLILEIRRLLFDEGLTIAGARKQIESMIDSGKLDLAEPEPEPVKKARPKPAPAKAKEKAEPEPAHEPEPAPEPAIAEAKPAPAAAEAKPVPEVDKAPRADVQPLLATLRGVRKELAEIVEQLRSSS